MRDPGLPGPGHCCAELFPTGMNRDEFYQTAALADASRSTGARRLGIAAILRRRLETAADRFQGVTPAADFLSGIEPAESGIKDRSAAQNTDTAAGAGAGHTASLPSVS